MQRNTQICLLRVGLHVKTLGVVVIALVPSGIVGAAETVGLPAKVAAFLERRESCDHWRGERGYDKERQADIDWAMCQACPGTDAQLARLKKKYAANKAVMQKLSEIEPNIEPEDKAAAQRFCSKTRKPKWQE